METRKCGSVTSRAKRYFIPSKSESAKKKPDIKYLECTLCNRDVNCNTDGNMVPHLRNHHREEYSLYVADKPGEDPLVSRLKFIHSCVELVTINGKTFSTLYSSGFIRSHEDKLHQLKKAGCPVNLSDENLSEIKDKIHSIATSVRKKIMNEVKGRVLSLMIDGVTRNHRSLLGTSVQYTANGKIKTIPIAVTELLQSHTAKYLSTVIKKQLESYGIDLRAILTVTSDNAQNMISTTKELEEELKKIISGDEHESGVTSDEETVCDDFTDDDDDGSIEERIRKVIDDKNDSDALDSIFDETASYETLLSSVTNDLRTATGDLTLFVDQVRCAAHTLQLAINDALNLLDGPSNNIISLCRTVAKYLRLPSTQYTLQEKEIYTIFPPLDVETRWNSTYLMVK